MLTTLAASGKLISKRDSAAAYLARSGASAATGESECDLLPEQTATLFPSGIRKL